MSDLAAIPLGEGGTSKREQYYAFTCSRCGDEARNTYCEPSRTNMLNRRLCWTCNYWADFAAQNRPAEMTIIAGHVYSPGNRTEGSFLGMAGRRFDIEYLPTSAYSGQRITTHDLWSGSEIPVYLRAQYPDTAIFLSGAEKVQVGPTTCWNPGMDRKQPEYPSPSSLRRTAPAQEGESHASV